MICLIRRAANHCSLQHIEYVWIKYINIDIINLNESTVIKGGQAMQYQKLVFVFVVLAFFLTGEAQAAGDPAAGKDKAAACAGCHGADGNSMAPTFPKLSGQYAAYLVKQVEDFLKNKRKDATMSGMAAAAGGPQDLEDIAAFYASQKIMRGTAVESSLAAAGKKFYIKGNQSKGIYGCINCHGKNGKGLARNNPYFPVIGGQHKEYLKKTLHDFKSGARTNDPAGMMRNIAKLMSDKEINMVAEYLSGR